MSKESSSQITGNWSGEVNGLSGRLRIQFEDLKPGLRHAVYLELKNQSDSPITITNQPQIHSELLDTEGRPVTTSGLSMSGPIPFAQWAVIPRDAYLGFRVDMQTAGVPTREQGTVLLALGGLTWELGPGKYVLHASVEFERNKDAPANQWLGDLKLPPTEIVVTSYMPDQ